MFYAKELITRTNRVRGRLLTKTFPIVVGVKQPLFRRSCILDVSSSVRSLNLKVLLGNINLKFCGGYSDTFSKMEGRQSRKELFKQTILSYLNTDPKFTPLTSLETPVKRNFEIKNTAAAQHEVQGIDSRQSCDRVKQRQYFHRVVMHSLGKNPADSKKVSEKPPKVTPLEFNLCGENVWNTRTAIEDAPKNALQNLFADVANKYKSPLFLLEIPEFIQNDALSCSCTYRIIWPKPKSFTELGVSKKDASHNAAVAALQWLERNHYMNQFGKPIFHHILQSRLKLNDNVGFKPQVRTYSTTSKVDINANNISPAIAEPNVQTEQKAIENVKSLYPAPKSVLHNCFDVLSNELKQKDLKLAPQYKIIKEGKKSLWMCTYNLKWPEVIKFSEMAHTKSEASTKAAMLALSWLKANQKITKEGQPVIFDRKEVTKLTKKTYPAMVLNKFNENKLNEIVTIYKNGLVTKLSTDFEKEGDDTKTPGEELAEKWPEAQKLGRFQQKFMGLEFYLAREPVQLPISKYRENIVELLRNNQVLIIRGEPGCGKSTRVPQYVLEAWARSGNIYGQPCRIIVTQPRRIAAISLAERVANEREETVGRTVGYHVRLNSNFDNRTGRIMYCTTGILLRRLQSDPTLSDCSHVLLDEAHERDVNTDLLMNLLRHALNLNPNLKILIMSATIDPKIFQDYFNNAPVLNIPGFTYPVEQHFLKEESEYRTKTSAMSMGQFPSIVSEDVVKSIKYIHDNKPEGAILCFLPGWEDIMKVMKSIPERGDLVVLCLHSRLQMSEQRKIFSRPPPGVRKIILATNIAETSVTIDDVVYVIDTGIHKEERFDSEKGVRSIDNHWISQASAIQRKGRAGRCQPGECFHLYPESKYDQLLQYSIPEILRTSLTKIVLDSKVYSNNMNAAEFLQQLVCPPEKTAIEQAVAELQELELLDENENLTPLGRTLSDFQLAPKLSKAMVNAVIFKCVTPIIDIATLYSAETALFSRSLVDKEGIKNVMKKFSEVSDHLAFMELFETWLNLVEEGNVYEAEQFCYNTGLVPYKLKTLQKLRSIHIDYLTKGLKKVLPLSDDLSDNSELVRAVLLSGVGTVLQHRTWDIVKGRLKKSNIFLTRNNAKATITSESVNFKKSKFVSDFLLYINETVSNLRHTTLVRETSQISPLAVLLFRIGELEIEDIVQSNYSDKLQSSDQVLLKLQGTKIRFLCDRQQAVAIQKCKQVLRLCTQYYIYQLTKGGNCDFEVDGHWQEILASLNQVLESQKVGRK